MDLAGRPRPSVSRETRLLFVTVLISLVALWVLARVRFADRPMTANPVAPVLTQLAAPPVFEQLSTAVFQVNKQIAPFMFNIAVRPAGSSGRGVERVAALRLPGGIAVAMLAPSMALDTTGPTPTAAVLARDPASGLTILGVPTNAAIANVSPLQGMWSPRRPQDPRYLVAADITLEGVTGRPVFVGALRPISSPVWRGTLWALPAGTSLTLGAFVFTMSGAFAGLVTDASGALVLAPGDVLSDSVDRLRSEGRRDYGRLGVEMQSLPPGVLSTVGRGDGVIVTWVEPQGPAAGQLNPGDVIVAAGDEAVSGFDDWQASTARLAVGEAIRLRVQRGDTGETVTLTAVAPQSEVAKPRVLGMLMRAVPRRGAEVLRVESKSAAAEAGIEAGDVIVSFGGRPAPGPAEIRRVFATATSGQSLVVTLARRAVHRVLVLETR